MSTQRQISTPTLSTPRTILRPYTRADETAFVTLFRDDQVNRFVGDGTTDPVEDLQALFGRIFDIVYANQRFAVWAIEYDGQFAGHAEIKPSPADDVDGWEIIYMLRRDVWGKGLATEVARAITMYGFEEVGLEKVYATIMSENLPSARVLGKVGYKFVAERVEENMTVHIYAIERK